MEGIFVYISVSSSRDTEQTVSQPQADEKIGTRSLCLTLRQTTFI